MRRGVWGTVWRWLLFTAIGGVFPLSISLFPYLVQKEVGGTVWDALSHGELILIATVLVVASIGDVIGHSRWPWLMWPAVCGSVGLAFFGAGFYGWLQKLSEQNDAETLGKSSIYFFGLCIIVSLACKLLGEVES